MSVDKNVQNWRSPNVKTRAAIRPWARDLFGEHRAYSALIQLAIRCWVCQGLMHLEMALPQLPGAMSLRFSVAPFPVYTLACTDELKHCTVSAVRLLGT